MNALVRFILSERRIPMATKQKPKAKSKSKATVSLSPTADRQWQIEEDARMLKRAQEIRNDPARLKSAQKYCAKEMEALKQVSKMK